MKVVQEETLVPIKFGMNWVAQAEHGGYYQAVVSGFYRECGLDVEIIPGGVRTAGRKRLLSGDLDFYLGGNMVGPFLAVSRGLPVKVVAAHFQVDPQIIMSHPGTFNSFEDLTKARIFLNDGIFNSYFRLMIDEFGFRKSRRRYYNLNSFLADSQSIHQGILTAEPFILQTKVGFQPNVYLLADYGLTSYSTLLETTAEIIDLKPDVVQCFVDASAKGWYVYLYGDSSLANEAIKSDNPDVSDAQLQYAAQRLRECDIVDSGDALEYGIGAMRDDEMRRFFSKLVKAGIVRRDVNYKDAYTLQFVNKGVGLNFKKRLTKSK